LQGLTSVNINTEIDCRQCLTLVSHLKRLPEANFAL
jgi:hypothetical protein